MEKSRLFLLALFVFSAITSKTCYGARCFWCYKPVLREKEPLIEIGNNELKTKIPLSDLVPCHSENLCTNCIEQYFTDEDSCCPICQAHVEEEYNIKPDIAAKIWMKYRNTLIAIKHHQLRCQPCDLEYSDRNILIMIAQVFLSSASQQKALKICFPCINNRNRMTGFMGNRNHDLENIPYLLPSDN